MDAAVQCNANYANVNVIEYRRIKERMQELKVPSQETLAESSGCKGKGERHSSQSRNFDSGRSRRHGFGSRPIRTKAVVSIGYPRWRSSVQKLSKRLCQTPARSKSPRISPCQWDEASAERPGGRMQPAVLRLDQ
jgi:hypothetical protein